MNKFNFSSMFKPMTKEEIKQRMVEKYNRDLETPENFSNWFPKIARAMSKTNTPLKYPKSVGMVLPFEWIEWLRSDDYSDEKIAEFNKYIYDSFSSFLKDGKSYFIKTGNFSDKFNFVNPKVDNFDNIGYQFMNIFYTAMVLGADSSNEFVIREYIEPKTEVKTIYNGMPLHTEYRIFVHIDGDDSYIHDVVNYWHPKVMRTIYDKEDVATYLSVEDELVKRFNANKDFVSNEVLKVAKHILGITGSWSIDVMQNVDDFYVIDSARMSRSALVEFVPEEVTE